MYVDGQEDVVLFLFVRAAVILTHNTRSTSIQLTRNFLPVPAAKFDINTPHKTESLEEQRTKESPCSL